MVTFQVLVFDPSTELEVEVVAHSSGTVWNKADGVDRLIKNLGDSLETPGRVLICGDTPSDLPMGAVRCPSLGQLYWWQKTGSPAADISPITNALEP
ncbi:unnamed protein product [Gongylonema pulchrum]|uniref:Trehalose-6-phosphate phosphatase C-terminal domain-containing protein n=1 Tax=Gongylonema pulchrum TaxID=637853 RepID=A0A3P7RI81_9BILA|nr:unnamed protein product [Gongylonema pulchrum]